jgi:hypothetical protein
MDLGPKDPFQTSSTRGIWLRAVSSKEMLMLESCASVRPAVSTDAFALAEFVNMAGESMPLYLWTKMATPGEDP